MSNKPSVDTIKGDWHREHAARAGDYSDRPWGIQWGGPPHVTWVRHIVTPHVTGKRVFEIGCGGGKYTKMLFECGAALVAACDVHETALTESAKYEPRAVYILGDGETIPAGNGSYDLVFTYDVLLHLPPGLVVKYLQEGCRVADEMIVQLPTLDLPASREWFLRRVEARRYYRPYTLGYFNFYTDDMIEMLISLGGWMDITVLGHNERDSVWLCRK